MQYGDVSGKGWGHIYNKTASGCNLIMDTTMNDCFAIGKQQWGDLVNYSRNQIVPFPISFQNSCYCVVITTTRSDGDAYNNWVSAKQNKNFTINFYNTALNTNSASWCSIGCQQWGLTDHISGNATKIVQFPLAYTTFSHWVANSRSSSTNESSWCTGGYNGTLTGFTARSNGTEIEWIATGLQQWGFVAGTTRPLTATLPLTVGTFFTAVSGCKYDGTCGDGNSWYSASNSQIKLWGHTGSQQGKTYVMIGKAQQWGKTSSSGRATTTVTLPISMSSQIYNVVISQAAASDTWSTWSSIVSASQIKLTNNYGPGSWWYATGY